MTQTEPKRRGNQRIYDLAVSLEIALIECDEMGLEADRVEFDGRFNPRIYVQDNSQTRQLLKEGKARIYGTEARNGVRQHLVQMMLHNCKIIWKTDFLTH